MWAHTNNKVVQAHFVPWRIPAQRLGRVEQAPSCNVTPRFGREAPELLAFRSITTHDVSDIEDVERLGWVFKMIGVLNWKMDEYRSPEPFTTWRKSADEYIEKFDGEELQAAFATVPMF